MDANTKQKKPRSNKEIARLKKRIEYCQGERLLAERRLERAQDDLDTAKSALYRARLDLLAVTNGTREAAT